VVKSFYLTCAPSCYKEHEGQVIFLEHTPAAPLNACIRSLWYARVEHSPHARERILPTGRVQIILNLQRDFLLDCPEGQSPHRMPPSLVVGARSTYEIVDTSDMADLIGIVFHPGGFLPFACDSVDLFSNRSVRLEDVWGATAHSLRDRLREISTPGARLRCLEAFLLQRFAGRLSRHPIVDFALNSFQRAPGLSTVRAVARDTGWSERRFSQVFREQVGFSPKAWTRILRFQRVVQQLHAKVDVPWAEMALDCGYYDQSHFANEFRAFSGIDATTYSARRTVWANHVAAS
jgi:AraC-like DNA-binding protein